MKNFTYYQPKTIAAAAGLLGEGWGKSEILAGGTSLLDLLKDYVAQPERVVSLSAVPGPELNNITRDDTKKIISIGAMVKLATIAENETMRKLFPALTTAAGIIGGPQIRNMGTLGGNLCQRNTCWYFRDEHVSCLLKGGKKCFATDGENQYHAVFTRNQPCVIVNPSSLAGPLIALGATAHVASSTGERTIPMADFFRAPSKPEHREHVMGPNEILTRVSMSSEPAQNATYEVRHKQSHDWPLVQATVAMQLMDGRASGVKVVLGFVAPIPHIADAAAKALEGKHVSEATAGEAGKAATEGAAPLTQNGYKLKLIEVAVKRAALIAAGAKRYWEV